MNSHLLLSALQDFMRERGLEPEQLDPEGLIRVMVEWFQQGPDQLLGKESKNQSLLYRYGSWSEGCATGFKLSLLKVVTQAGEGSDAQKWMAGITLVFEPSRYAAVPAFSTTSTDWQSMDGFISAIRNSAGYKLSLSSPPMGAALEIGALR